MQRKSSFAGPEEGILSVGGNVLDAQKFLFFIFGINTLLVPIF